MDARFPAKDETVLADILEARASDHPDKTFAVFKDAEDWSYRDVAEKSWSVGHGLIELGVQPGDHVLSWLPTGPHAIQTWLGTNAAGGVYTPLNPAYKGRILEHTVNLPKARVLIAHAQLVDRLQGLELPHLEKVVIMGDREDAGEIPNGLELLAWNDIERPGSARPDVTRELWDDMAVIYTSGTTGPSKGVRCSYLHHYTFGKGLFPEEIGADDRFFLCLPMFHASGTNVVYSMLQRGASVAVTQGFSTDTFWDDIREFNVTSAIIMAAMANFLYKQPAKEDDNDNPLRIAYMGPMIDDVEGFSDRFGVQLYTNYAMTEVPCCITTELNPKNPRSCGTLRSDSWEIRIVDEYDRELPDGTIGELIVRHDRPWSLNSGYVGMPERTADAWRNGWFHTGDALKRDEEGNYYFVDRIKDALRRRGENISSAEVENEILAHSAVQETAVIAVPSDVGEDDVMAVIVLQPDKQLDYKEIVDFLVPRLPYFMVPRYFEIVDQLPKTPTMKIQKYKLRERGITKDTWDREEAGIRLRREKFTKT